jgi:hypothetical protein
MEQKMNIMDYILLKEAISTTALENELTEEEINSLNDSIMRKLRGEE